MTRYKLRRLEEALHCNLVGMFPHLIDKMGVAPFTASLRVTHRCVGRCQSCNFWMDRESRELTTSQWKHIIQDLSENGVQQIDLTGGDIFLRQDIFELIQFSNDLGMRVRCAISGYTVTPQIARALMETSIAAIFVSLDDLGPDSDVIRGVRDSSRRAQECVRWLKQFDNGTTVVYLAPTIMKSTIPVLRPLVQFALDNSLPVNFNLIHFTHRFSSTPFSREQYNLDATDKAELYQFLVWLAERCRAFPNLLPRLAHLEWMRNYFDDYHQKQTPCYQLMLKLCIGPEGDVRPCCSMDNAGNLAETNVRTILGSDQFITLVKKGVTKDCPGCSCRYATSLNANAGSYIRETLLRLGVVKL